MVQLTHERARAMGVSLGCVAVGSGPAMLCRHGRPHNLCKFLPLFGACSHSYPFIVWQLLPAHQGTGGSPC
jgi:hypothetical protein